VKQANEEAWNPVARAHQATFRFFLAAVTARKPDATEQTEAKASRDSSIAKLYAFVGSAAA
jgi:hypothetical protein